MDEGTAREGAVAVFVVAGVQVHREALGRLLDGRGSLRIVGTGPDSAAVASCSRVAPGIFLVDTATVECPGAIRRIRRGCDGTKIVALGVHETVDELLAFAEAGVSSYVTSEQSLDDLVATLERAARGEALCSPRMAAALLERVGELAWEREPSGDPILTAREVEIVELVDRGLSNKQIARELCIELATVKNHVHHILAKFKVTGRAQAAARWRSIGPTRVPRARAHINGGLQPDH
jgi:two-component system, NarL family, nitrate/nitrite response regulator NarL